MKKTRIFVLLIFVGSLFTVLSCKDDVEDSVSGYLAWNDENVAYFEAAKVETDDNGDLLYEMVIPNWDTASCVLMHFYEKGIDTSLSPYYTSYVKVNYLGQLIDETVFDSTYVDPENTMTAKISSLVDGWAVAMEKMHVGDSCRVVIPQNLGYGTSSSGTIKPYSTLIFDIKLIEIVRQ